ncbi:MAG: TetR family transcriptional regulator [Alphaproteobacteria bacterium]|nr:TetR family transcriptional regulator [Alphaproteobacteria bacterium]
MARRTKEKAEQTRKDILQASLNMFCEKGYTRTTLDDIAKSINLTKGAVYWYFKNKPDILKALMLEDFKSTQAKLDSYIPSPYNLEELKQHFKFLAKMVDTDSNFRKLLYFLLLQMEWSTGLINSFQDIIEELSKRPIQTIEQALLSSQNSGQISSSVDVKMTACTIHAMWHGLIMKKLQHQDDINLQQLTDYSFDFVNNALMSRKD